MHGDLLGRVWGYTAACEGLCWCECAESLERVWGYTEVCVGLCCGVCADLLKRVWGHTAVCWGLHGCSAGVRLLMKMMHLCGLNAGLPAAAAAAEAAKRAGSGVVVVVVMEPSCHWLVAMATRRCWFVVRVPHSYWMLDCCYYT